MTNTSKPRSSKPGAVYVLNPETMVLTHQGNGTKTPLHKFHSKRATYVFDAGHGVDKDQGRDHGAPAKFGSMDEAAVNYHMAMAAAKEAAATGADSIVTRDNHYRDSGDGFAFRRAAKNKGDVYVSLHVNSADSSKASGMRIYSDSRAGEGTKALHRQLAVEHKGDLISDDLMRTGPYKMLGRGSTPAVLLEVGFGTNRQDAQKMQSPSWRKRVAKELSREMHHFYHRYIARDGKQMEKHEEEPVAPEVPAEQEIIVRKGQSLHSIAETLAKTGSEAEIKAIAQTLVKENHLKDPDHLVAGMHLTIPDGMGKTTAPEATRVKVGKGDTLMQIAREAQRDFKSDLSLKEIVAAFVKVNRIKDDDALKPGQTLTVPWNVSHSKPAKSLG